MVTLSQKFIAIYKYFRDQRTTRIIVKSSLFDFDYYLREHPDLAVLETNPVAHYKLHGQMQNLQVSQWQEILRQEN